jgi:hypothetical protein
MLQFAKATPPNSPLLVDGAQICLASPLLSLLLLRWSGPYLRRMIESVKATHPNTPLTLYANGSGGLLERLGATGADVVGLDWTVDMADARKRLGSKSVQVRSCLGHALHHHPHHHHHQQQQQHFCVLQVQRVHGTAGCRLSLAA